MAEQKKKKEMAQITGLAPLSEEIFSLWIKTDMALSAVPGQFVSFYCQDSDRLLPRPISICEINREQQMMRFVFRVVGAGTNEFSKMSVGDKISVLGPLGNGFPLLEGKSLLIGGGIGIPPMLELAKSLRGKVTVVLGYRDADLFLKEEFLPFADVYVSTEDGSVGTKGNVIDAIRENSISDIDVIYSCGPTPMLRGVKAYGEENGIETYLSMEEHMACGVGACLACVCESKEVDSHSKVKNKRVCKDGPVFRSTDVLNG